MTAQVVLCFKTVIPS